MIPEKRIIFFVYKKFAIIVKHYIIYSVLLFNLKIYESFGFIYKNTRT